MARVGTESSVSATAGTDTTDNNRADSGQWTAGPIQKTTAAKLTAGDDPVLLQAECTFTFAGTKANSPVADTSKVTLSPGATRLQTGPTDVLLDGDSAQDSFGNTLTVAVPASSKLSSGNR